MRCACCRLRTIPKGKSDVICRECGWHQDGTGPGGYSPANRMTLEQGQANFAATGNCDTSA